MPFNPDTSLLDSSLLCEFLADCELPATIEIAEGYDSNESVEQSWSQGETVYLHAMKDVPQVLGLDSKGNHFSIPLNYPKKIFESIPNRCSDKYGAVEELLVDFPKYVRSLRNIPQSGVKVGDILCLEEISPNAAGCMELKCRVADTPGLITLSGDQVGPFETLDDVNPISMRDATERNLLPTRVRVRGGTQVFNDINKNEEMIFEGLFTIKEIVQEKIVIASTLHDQEIRVVKLPIDLEMRVRKENLNIDPRLFTEICGLIERDVDIDSTIISGKGEASWSFDITQLLDTSQPDNIYEELALPGPPVPPRSPLKQTGSVLKQTTKICTPESDSRYAPAPRASKPKPSPKPTSPVAQKEDGELPGPPPVAKKPSMHKQKPRQPIPPLVINNSAKKNLKSHNEPPRRSEATPRHSRADAEGHHTRCIGDTQSVSPSQPKPAHTPVKPVVQKGSPKKVAPQFVKPKPNTPRQKSVEAVQQPPSFHCSTPDETEGEYEVISKVPSIAPQKEKPAGNPEPPVVMVKESPTAAPLPHGKITPNAHKQKPVKENVQLPSFQHSLSPSSSLEKKENKDISTNLTPQNVESHTEATMTAARSDCKADEEESKTGAMQNKGYEILKDISVSEVSEWLKKLGLSKYVDRFAEETIDGNLLLELDAEMMEHLGISNPLHKKKLMMFIQKGWTPKRQ